MLVMVKQVIFYRFIIIILLNYYTHGVELIYL